MNKEGILKTATTRWCRTEARYRTESPLSHTLFSTGLTARASLAKFVEIVEEAYAAQGNVQPVSYPGPGRPRKGKVALRAEVSPAVKAEIVALAQALEVSHGEAVEFLIAYYRQHAEGTVR